VEDKYSDSILAGNWDLMEVSGLVNSTIVVDNSQEAGVNKAEYIEVPKEEDIAL